MHLLASRGFQVRIVGGAVRDSLAGREPRDVDLATDASPDEVMYVLAYEGIDFVGKGISHGTVKAVLPEGEFEITSLGFRMGGSGRPTRSSVTGWLGDAMRRDFTINSMSVDREGNLYDYMGGVDDLKGRIVRTIGDPRKRFAEDPVLVLRFFKLVSMFPGARWEPAAVDAIKAAAQGLGDVSEKRRLRELENIRRQPNADAAIALMCELGLDRYLPIDECDGDDGHHDTVIRMQSSRLE
jgi:poly(A) polymerase